MADSQGNFSSRLVRLAGTDAVNWFAPAELVTRPAPFHSTMDLFVHPEPFTVSMNAGPPAVTVLGLSPEIVGAGGLMVKVRAFDAPAPGLRTVTLALP